MLLYAVGLVAGLVPAEQWLRRRRDAAGSLTRESELGYAGWLVRAGVRWGAHRARSAQSAGPRRGALAQRREAPP